MKEMKGKFISCYPPLPSKTQKSPLCVSLPLPPFPPPFLCTSCPGPKVTRQHSHSLTPTPSPDTAWPSRRPHRLSHRARARHTLMVIQ